MIFEHHRERDLRRALRAIARQRVAMVLQPGNFLVIEQAAPDSEWFDVAARTCLIRGWVAVLEDALPNGKLSFEGGSPVLPTSMAPRTFYRLTEGGWAVINRSQTWVVATFFVALVTLAATIAGIYFTLQTPESAKGDCGKAVSSATAACLRSIMGQGYAPATEKPRTP